MQVIINSSIIADGITDLQANSYKNEVLLCVKSSLKATLLEQQLVSHNIIYTRFGGNNGKQFEINCKSISAYESKENQRFQPNQSKEETSEDWVRRNNPQYAHMDDQEIRNMLT